MKMAKIEAAMRAALAFNQAVNRHDVAGMMALVREDCLFEASGPAPDGERICGRAALTAYWQAFFQAAPQAQREVEELFGLGMRCVLRWRWTGTPTPTRGVDIVTVQEGLICLHLSYVKG